MSSHSGTIGRKRGGSSSGVSGSAGGSEYYFSGGEKMRRQRSAEWHSRHGYNSSSEDEYQNTGQTSAFDTQLLAQLLLQSQQLANMDNYTSDLENEEIFSRLSEYPCSKNRDSSSNANDTPNYLHHLQQQHNDSPQQQSTALCSPAKHHQPSKTANTSATITLLTTSSTSATTTITANHKYLDANNSTITTSLGGFLPTPTKPARSTNPFLNSKYDSQSNSDSVSDRLSLSGSAIMLDRLQNSSDYGNGILNSAFMLPITANSLANSFGGSVRETQSTRRSKNGRPLNRSNGMTTSSSGTSSNSNATVSNTGRSEREKLKLQQLQMELREYAQAHVAADSSADTSIILDGAGGNIEELNDDDDGEPPPEPAPPEIPPRTQSLLMSLRKHSEYKLNYEEKGDQKHEEFIPTSHMQQQLQQQSKDYLIPEIGVRCSESQSKSIGSSETQSQQG